MNIETFFRAVIEQNEEELIKYFCEDAVINWHCSNECFTVTEYINVNCIYPDDWLGEIERCERYDSKIVIAAKVYPQDKSITYYVVSFITLQQDKIIQLDEYWSADSEIPEWRKKMDVGKPIRSY